MRARFILPLVLLTICVSAAAAVAFASNEQRPKRTIVREAPVVVPSLIRDGSGWRVEGGSGGDFGTGVVVPSVAKIDDPVDFEGSSSAGAAIAPGEEIQNSNSKGSGAKSERGVKK